MVGGYLTYEHQGNNLYEFTLRIYRDCNLGNASFQPTYNIKIRDQFGVELYSLTAPQGPVISVDTDTGGCVTTPPGICIEYSDYIISATLPPISGGYMADMSSCCRNAIIVNIPNPSRAGYTYNTNIPANDTLGNSSPQFAASPPVIVCLGRPLNVNLKVSDPDNDSLSYELCDIYNQGGYPYNPIAYNPPYNSLSPMPASPPFGVNPLTGELTGTPNQIGHYVVGVCVTEWRNGIPLSTVRLDYQFNVTSCTSIFSDMLTQAEDSTLSCRGFTMNFFSQSQNATTFYWDFGDTTTLADTSNLMNPTYTYSAPGFYTVMLIAEPGDTCGDTAFSVFEVRQNVTSGFFVDSAYCFPQQPIQLTAGTSNPAAAVFKWDFGPFATPSTSNLATPPPVRWSQGGNHYVELVITNGKCKAIYGDTIRLSNELKADFITPDEDSLMVCNGLGMQFISESVGAKYLHWDFGNRHTLSDTANTDTAYYTFPKQGYYLVKLIVGDGEGCFDTAQYLFEVFPKLDTKISKTGIFCFEGQNVTFEAIGTFPQGTDFTWNLDSLANKPIVKNPSATNIKWSAPGRYVISLTTIKGHCSVTVYDTVDIEAWTVYADAGPDTILKPNQLLQLNGSVANQYYWSSSHAVSISNPFGRSTSVDIPTRGDTISFYYLVTDANGCQGRDTMKVYVGLDSRDGGYNILTPNGDGRNDFLDLSDYMLGRDCDFTVMNRWGSEVYHAEKYQNDWPGWDNAHRPLPDGTYYYILFCDRTVTVKGPITIINSDWK